MMIESIIHTRDKTHEVQNIDSKAKAWAELKTFQKLKIEGLSIA